MISFLSRLFRIRPKKNTPISTPIALKPRLEWDPKKNESNKTKHHIGFEKAEELLSSGFVLQEIVHPDKWEDINEEDFEAKGIEKNFGNLNPVRSKLIGMIDSKIFTCIGTFRNDLQNLTYRIISLRRAHQDESKRYKRFTSK